MIQSAPLKAGYRIKEDALYTASVVHEDDTVAEARVADCSKHGTPAAKPMGRPMSTVRVCIHRIVANHDPLIYDRIQ
jgi:hypothetical protein